MSSVPLLLLLVSLCILCLTMEDAAAARMPRQRIGVTAAGTKTTRFKDTKSTIKTTKRPPKTTKTTKTTKSTSTLTPPVTPTKTTRVTPKTTRVTPTTTTRVTPTKTTRVTSTTTRATSTTTTSVTSRAPTIVTSAISSVTSAAPTTVTSDAPTTVTSDTPTSVTSDAPTDTVTPSTAQTTSLVTLTTEPAVITTSEIPTTQPVTSYSTTQAITSTDSTTSSATTGPPTTQFVTSQGITTDHQSTSSPTQDHINICFDCDGPCVTAITSWLYTNTIDYFTAVTDELNQILTNSKLPLRVNLLKFTTSPDDIVLDTTSLQIAMDDYWTGSSPTRFQARQDDGCTVSFFVTLDDVFSSTGEAAKAYVNSLCTQYAYSIAKLDVNVIRMASRVMHEMCHTMNINHVRDGEISFPTNFEVLANCYPDVCKDPTGICVTISSLPAVPPTTMSQCERAIFFAWRSNGYGGCLGPEIPYYDLPSGDGEAGR